MHSLLEVMHELRQPMNELHHRIYYVAPDACSPIACGAKSGSPWLPNQNSAARTIKQQNEEMSFFPVHDIRIEYIPYKRVCRGHHFLVGV